MTDNGFGNMLMYIYCVCTYHIGGATTRSVLSVSGTPLIQKKLNCCVGLFYFNKL